MKGALRLGSVTYAWHHLLGVFHRSQQSAVLSDHQQNPWGGSRMCSLKGHCMKFSLTLLLWVVATI